MNIDDYTKISHKHYSSDDNDDNKLISYLKLLITRILLSIIIVICVAIFSKMSVQNKKLINKYLFEDNLKFTQLNAWYQNKFGSLIPDISYTNPNSVPVFNDDILKSKYESYLDGVKIEITKITHNF